MRQTSTITIRRFLSVSLVAGLAAATSGCAYTMGDFSRNTAAATPAATDSTATSSLPMKPATYVVDTTNAAGAPTAAPKMTATAYPNINQVPDGPKSKLLSPEEKAKVISDLESLAESQEAAVEKSRKQATAQCGNALKSALDPEAKLKSEATGQGC